MRDHSHHIELSREQAVAQMIERCITGRGSSQARVEVVQLDEGYGRVLSSAVYARLDMPNALTCAMDSIAVHWHDFEEGMPETSDWVRGIDWEFANTGIAMPLGFDTAIVIEHVEVLDDEQRIKINAAPSQRFAGTRAVGSHFKVGDVLARSGEIITPDVAARVASGNVAAVQVFRKPHVAFIPTGNELIRPGGHIAYGKNIETNSLLVRGKVEEWGGIAQIFDVVPDSPEAIEEAVRLACRTADIVVLNAGSSKGSDDWSIEQLEGMGEIICHQTNHGPGHHSSYAMVADTPIVGISGPPAGASFTLNFYLRPLMRLYLGLEPEVPRIPVRLTAAFPNSSSGKKPSTDKTSSSVATPNEASSNKMSRVREDDSIASTSASIPGEVRPDIVTDPDAVFFNVKFLKISAGPDGVLQGTPLAGRPGSPEAESANAYYMMPTGAGIVAPRAGDVIEVELR